MKMKTCAGGGEKDTFDRGWVAEGKIVKSFLRVQFQTSSAGKQEE